MTAVNMLLVRIQVGRVSIEDREHLAQVLRQLAVTQEASFNCVEWIKSAVARLGADPQLSSACPFDWEAIREAGVSYCEMKKQQHRWNGKSDSGPYDASVVPTFDLVVG